MTSTLMWEPGPEVRKKHSLSDELKFALRKQYGSPVCEIMDEDDLRYLEGLRDAGLTEAQDLLDALGRYESIHVREES